jgi:beta-lactamase regulating signal transducer with metallopeptidase domain/LysM repeat protein
MNWVSPILEHSGILLAGGSAFLAFGLLINLLQRTPISRIRIAEMAVGSALVFGLLTLAPLPRAFAPEPITLSKERPPLPAIDLAPFLSLLETQPAASAEAASLPTIAALAEKPQLGPELLLSEPPMAAAIGTPLLLAEVEAAATAPLPWGKIALGIWLVGAALAAAWLLLGASRIRRVLRNSRPAPRQLLCLLRDQGVQFPRGVRLRLSDREVRPFCVGALRPTVVIPRSLLDEQPSISLASVVQHELAHATQGDARGLWLFAIALVPLWFHPLFWWLRAQHRFATELVADAIAADKTSNRAYARELMHLVERQAEQPTLVVGATALFRKRSDFYQRMQMLLTRNNSLATRTTLRRRALHGFLSLGLLTGAASVGGATPAAAQNPEADPAALIQRLQAENTVLRADLQEMQVVLSELKDMLTLMQMQRDFDRKAEAQDRLLVQMDRLDAREREVDAFMSSLDPNSPEQLEALAALGYRLVEDAAGYLPYTVKAGDTLTKIAGMTGLRSSEGLRSIARLNPDLFQIDEHGRVSGTYHFQPGETVLIPLQDASMPSSGSSDLQTGDLAGKTHTVKAGESLNSISESHGLTRLELQKIFVKLNPALIALDPRGHLTSTRPLQIGDELQIPYLVGIPPGSYFVNRDGSPTDPFADTPADPASVPFLADIPTIGTLFGGTGQPASVDRGLQAPAAQMRLTLPPVNLAECMELSFRAIDLQGELELARAAYEHSEQLAQQGLVGALELRQSRISMVTLERKYGLSRSVLEARMNDLKLQIDELSSHFTKEHPGFPRREISLRERALAVLAESF